jgi:hypothetical protein
MFINRPLPAVSNNWTTLVTSQITTNNLRNDFGGSVGMVFVCTQNSTCRAVGRWVVAGNTQTHVVALCDSNSCTVLAYATVVTSGAPAGAYAYGTLATPYAMTAGTTYFIFSQEYLTADLWYNIVSCGCTSLATGVQPEFALTSSLPTVLNSCTLSTGNTNQSFGPVNLQYTVP